MKRDFMRPQIPHINVPPPPPPSVRDNSKPLEYFDANHTYTEGTSPLKRPYRRSAPPPHPPQSCGHGQGGGGVLFAATYEADAPDAASDSPGRPPPQGGGQGGGGDRGLRGVGWGVCGGEGSKASIVHQLYSQINPAGPKLRDETRDTRVRGVGGGVVARMWTAFAGMYPPPHTT
jgi:hypothetical protein